MVLKSRRLVFIFILLVLIAATCWVLAARSSRPNVILVVIDTTRADHLGVYGYDRNTSPNLDKFAKDSWWFKNAITPAPWTPPAIASIFTGLYFSAHGMMPPDGRELALKTSTKLDPSLDTIAEIYQRNGYFTLGVTPNPWIKEEFNYNQGFERYEYKNRARAGVITRTAMSFVDEILQQKKPFFMFVHYLDPHDPYNPPEAYQKLFSGQPRGFDYRPSTAEKINLYDGEIRYMDDNIGEFFDYLKAKGLYESSHIVVIADHGEQFMEHGHTGHGWLLHNEEVHVPLFIRAAGHQSRQVDFTVSSTDVLPTLLELSDIPVPQGVQGISLVSDENSRARNGVISEIFRKFNQKAFVSFEGRKIIVQHELAAGPVPEKPSAGKVAGLYDRATDYLEQAPLNDQALQTVMLSDLDAMYQSILKDRTETKPDEITDSTLEQLKSLGYMQ